MGYKLYAVVGVLVRMLVYVMLSVFNVHLERRMKLLSLPPNVVGVNLFAVKATGVPNVCNVNQFKEVLEDLTVGAKQKQIMTKKS